MEPPKLDSGAGQARSDFVKVHRKKEFSYGKECRESGNWTECQVRPDTQAPCGAPPNRHTHSHYHVRSSSKSCHNARGRVRKHFFHIRNVRPRAAKLHEQHRLKKPSLSILSPTEIDKAPLRWYHDSA